MCLVVFAVEGMNYAHSQKEEKIATYLIQLKIYAIDLAMSCVDVVFVFSSSSVSDFSVHLDTSDSIERIWAMCACEFDLFRLISSEKNTPQTKLQNKIQA